MTTLNHIELACPICTTAFRSQTVVNTNAFGGKRTDFHERAAGMQPLPFFVHLCTTCGFAGVERDFCEEIQLEEETRERVLFELAPIMAPIMARESPTGSLKYEHAARVAEWQGAEPRYLADLFLRAAWCAVDEDDTAACNSAAEILRTLGERELAWKAYERTRLMSKGFWSCLLYTSPSPRD